MARYCITFDESTVRIVVHEQRCDAYTHGTLLSQGRVDDIGEHQGPLKALASVRPSFPDADLCHDCCPSARNAPVGEAG